MRIRKRRNTNETFIEYEGSDIKLYRYRLLNKIIEKEPSVVLIVDTNQRVGERPFDTIESFLQNEGVTHSVIPVKPNKRSFFGFGVDFGTKKRTEKILAAEISALQFPRKLYDEFFECYDIGIGIGSKKPFKEICDALAAGEIVLFDPQLFSDSVYDSVVCSSMRSTVDIKDYVEAVKHEVAL